MDRQSDHYYLLSSISDKYLLVNNYERLGKENYLLTNTRIEIKRKRKTFNFDGANSEFG